MVSVLQWRVKVWATSFAPIGMSARDIARIAYCMAYGGTSNRRQVIPKILGGIPGTRFA